MTDATVEPRNTLAGARFLVADDESFRDVLAFILRDAGSEVVTAATGEDAIRTLRQQAFDAIVTDISMPRGDGHSVLAHVRSACPEVPVFMMTAVAKELGNAVDAIKRGAFDYIQKGGTFSPDEFLRRCANAVELKRSREENARLRRLAGEGRSQAVIASDRMRDIMALVRRVAPTSTAVLITGESGTGKELIARFVHEASGRTGSFLTINCGAFPDDLLESELFGHARGAFTGAVTARKGLFEEADGGTLFLDEVGEMSAAMQVKLLRVLQEGRFRPVGETQERAGDVRIVAATNRDLEEMVREASFREDLYYRINVIPIHVPPLRERPEDIQALVRHFVATFSAEMHREIRQVTPGALEILERHGWPGNVRELRNVIERAMALATTDVLDETTLPERLRGGPAAPGQRASRSTRDELPAGATLDDHLDDIRRRLIEAALRETGGNQTRAAERLRITFRALRYYVQKYGIQAGAASDGDRTN